jgi:hypothetical protein
MDIKDELAPIMEAWATWMHHGGNISKGYPSQVSYIQGAGKQSSDDFYDETQFLIGSIVNAIVNDLDTAQMVAINHCYLGSKWLYNINEYPTSLETALDAIKVQAIAKGIL